MKLSLGAVLLLGCSNPATEPVTQKVDAGPEFVLEWSISAPTDLQPAIKVAMDDWASHVACELSYSFVSLEPCSACTPEDGRSTKADILVVYGPAPESALPGEHAWGFYNSDGTAKITLLTGYDFGPDLHRVLTHELGHALRLDHDNRSYALMNGGPDHVGVGSPVITQQDVDDYNAMWCGR